MKTLELRATMSGPQLSSDSMQSIAVISVQAFLNMCFALLIAYLPLLF